MKSVNFKKYSWLIITIIIFSSDRLTKYLALKYLVYAYPINVLPILNWHLGFNYGAAFSFLDQANGWQEWLFIGIAIVASIFLVIWQRTVAAKYLWTKIAIATILGGTIGNLYDRITYHYVIDFIDFYFKEWHYPIFNIADMAICIGTGILILNLLINKHESKDAS